MKRKTTDSTDYSIELLKDPNTISKDKEVKQKPP